MRFFLQRRRNKKYKEIRNFWVRDKKIQKFYIIRKQCKSKCTIAKTNQDIETVIEIYM